MEYTVRLEDGTDLQLTDVDVATKGDQIAFSIDGRIENIDNELMEVFQDKSLRPAAITFEAQDDDRN
ncbi:hypothetical protein [Haladaptatus sp. DYF46]|uniref:hypothetical protein n=1 Tax=Haladaptatus sp. DYF46 TaxID=2886041 RepID=UPI001E38DF22|nr:hypothetical protein [Haladaptatus sp. DYF46]